MRFTAAWNQKGVKLGPAGGSISVVATGSAKLLLSTLP